MKPNDKAIKALAKIIEDRLPDEGGRGISEFERQEFVNDMAVDGLTAAYAAQFKSEDYAGLIEELRYECSLWLRPNCVKKAPDALEALLAEREAWKRQAEICRDRMQETEITLGKYVQKRDACKNGNGQFTLENTFQSLLDMIDLDVKTAHEKIAAIEERDAALTEIDAISSAIKSHRYMDPPDGGSVTIAEQVARMWEDNEALRTERDALLARLAPMQSPQQSGEGNE